MADMHRLDRAMNEYAAVPMGGYNQTRVLAATTAERVSIPAGAIAVLFSCTDHFIAKGGDNAVTATVPGDVDDGTGQEINPTLRRLEGTDTHISVIALAACYIQLKFLKAPN